MLAGVVESDVTAAREFASKRGEFTFRKLADDRFAVNLKRDLGGIFEDSGRGLRAGWRWYPCVNIPRGPGRYSCGGHCVMQIRAESTESDP